MNTRGPAVVTVGDELVSGERENNGNERWLQRELSRRLKPAQICMQVGDDAEHISSAVGFLLSSGHKPIFVVGGMGGTHDDVTREGVARAHGCELTTSAECDAILRAMYDGSEHGYTEERRRMAELPNSPSLRLLPNPIGAPGFALDERVYAFPGFPRMLQPMCLEVLAVHAPEPDEASALVTTEAMLETREAAVAADVEAFAREWGAKAAPTTLGIYPVAASNGARVKLRLRYPKGREVDVREAFDAMVQRMQERITQGSTNSDAVDKFV